MAFLTSRYRDALARVLERVDRIQQTVVEPVAAAPAVAPAGSTEQEFSFAASTASSTVCDSRV
jgi:hypothetical protein